MRWDNLFDDLESQLEQGLTAEETDLQAEEERLRLGRLTIRDRIVALSKSYERREQYAIRLLMAGGISIDVRPVSIGRDWLSGDLRDGSARQRQCIVSLSAISGILMSKEQVRRSLRAADRETESSVAARLSLPFVLRDLCRRRVFVEIAASASPLTGSSALTGTIDRVGKDHLDLAVHDAGTPRRDSAVSHYRMVPLREVTMIML